MEQEPMLLEDKKFALYGKRTESGTPKLSFQCYRGNPSLVVFTNDPKDTEKKPIRAAMDPLIWGGFISALKKTLSSENGFQVKMPMLTGKPSARFTKNTVVVGKDDDGVVYIAIAEDNRPTKKFSILPGMYMEIVDRQGNPFPDGEVSALYAPGFVDQLEHHMTHYIQKTYTPPQPQQGGNRGGNNYNRSNGGGGNSGYDDVQF